MIIDMNHKWMIPQKWDTNVRKSRGVNCNKNRNILNDHDDNDNEENKKIEEEKLKW